MTQGGLMDLRRRLATTLPGQMQRVAEGYDAFAAQPPPDDAKAFQAHHAACKAALAHLDLLVKLARWAEGGEAAAEGGADDDVDALLAQARAALEDLDE